MANNLHKVLCYSCGAPTDVSIHDEEARDVELCSDCLNTEEAEDLEEEEEDVFEVFYDGRDLP